MRPVALALPALALASALAGCRADSVAAEPAAPRAEPERPPPPQPAANVTALQTAIATAPAAAVGTADLATGGTAAPAKPAPAAEPTERDRPPAGCIDSVAELPAADFLRADDRRLTRGTLIVVSKRARRLMLYDEGKSVACYRVALGFAPEGHKTVQGDGRTPEGWYRTSDKPWSSFENAIAIHYPNADDARAAEADGRVGKRTRDQIVGAIEAGKVPPQATKLGGAVLIHGGGSSFDWTLGCVALDDDELVALRDRLPKGMRTDLLILP